ncbi:MAG TPA: hypothetical protein PKD54_04785 [Pirellulaceae bacterium]|nr:hypothetical protein [Pirellulaceae bacterium]
MAKSTIPRTSQRIRAALGVLIHPAFFFFFVAGGVLGGASWCWQQFGSSIDDRGRWQLAESMIEFNSGMPWYSEARSQRLIRQLAAETRLLTDPALIERAVQIVQAEPSIDSIESIEKHRRGVTIVARYRLPVGWIGDDSHIRLIDATGVAVVPDRAGTDWVTELPRLLMPDLRTMSGTDWMVWPDLRVLEGAEVCRDIASRAKTWGVNRVVTYWRFAERPSLDAPWELWTPNGARILYRNAATADSLGALKRLAAIDEWITTNGRLDSIPAGYVLDVRDGHAKIVPQLRAARKDYNWR